jgi:hypothetical protein
MVSRILLIKRRSIFDIAAARAGETETWSTVCAAMPTSFTAEDGKKRTPIGKDYRLPVGIAHGRGLITSIINLHAFLKGTVGEDGCAGLFEGEEESGESQVGAVGLILTQEYKIPNRQGRWG